ncbi:MAG: phosphatase PAP2 family protein [Prevotellaceae bacterium]|nr:phosphatase PAP2 family protein [Prevotellaceae bacterium]
MFKFIKQLFAIEKSPKKGLLALECVMLAYLVFTLFIVFFTYTKAQNPDAMIWGRIRIAVITAALWGVYRMLPCRFTRFTRIVVQLALLSWWYPDTYEINRMLPNLDHLFASWEQSIFGCQPALLFCKAMPWHFFSELMDLGYASYYPMIGVVVLFYFFFRYREFERAAFVVLASFFIYYVVFILVPVVGPTFYYKAVGVNEIAKGVFPNLHDYFNYYQDCLPSPGYKDGIFYHFVESAKAAGERPTAAFPSSHVGVSTVLMLLAWHTGNRRFLYILLPFYILLCFATVYIQAHYAIDAFAGLITGVALYFLLMAVSKRLVSK